MKQRYGLFKVLIGGMSWKSSLIGIFPVLLLTMNLGLSAQNEALSASDAVMIIDTQHYSHTFSDVRNYRIFLPPDYQENQKQRYPVIYFFHGWAQRYFGEWADGYSDYEKGDDNGGDNIAAFVARRDVIVVKIDGWNQFPGEDLNLSPFNIGKDRSFRQFPIYFREFVTYVDDTYRTLPDRAHRAISGLSMGGFMSFWIGGKYPDLVSGIGNFCGSLEMITGPTEFSVYYNHMDMYDNYHGIDVRFHYGTRDRLRYYHYDFLKIWPQVMDNFQYHVYDADHVTCGLGDMFEFLWENFEKPPVKPDSWDHIDVYPNFKVWDYDIASDRTQAGFTRLENVNIRGFKSSIRSFLPDGELMSHVNLTIKTPPIYVPDNPYVVMDLNVSRNQIHKDTLLSDAEGRLKIHLNGDEHHIGINKKNDLPNISINSVKVKNMNWATTKTDVVLTVSLINKGLSDARNLELTLNSFQDYVKIKKGEVSLDRVVAEGINSSTADFTVLVTEDSIEMVRFQLLVQDQNSSKWIEDFELKFRKDEPAIERFVIADGGHYTVVHGGVDSITGTVGVGNGDGIANPGESLVLLVESGGKYYRTDAYSSDPHLNPYGVYQRIPDSWAEYDHIGGGPRYTVPMIASDCPASKKIEFWVEYWLPNNPEHIIKRGRIEVEVQGEEDQTAPVFRWLSVTNDKNIQVKLNDGTKVEDVRLTMIPDSVASTKRYLSWTTPEEFSVTLHDDGKDGDKCADDNVFSARIKGKAAYFYKTEITSQDALGNKSTVLYEKPVYLQNTR
ncbi:MAG: hypothetical protein HKN76_06985 [Saprospiraceae bacterium]|nr:hypothetical protein [Saprospiraceae bacterium]